MEHQRDEQTDQGNVKEVYLSTGPGSQTECLCRQMQVHIAAAPKQEPPRDQEEKPQFAALLQSSAQIVVESPSMRS
ncbi:hypothetical protein Taro_025513 [Colocasia esculenta]|uniref:Uncharacterized protein n=1 Tax=Colocasia esculenta TaxID=4460 RepID=A0A843V9K2_COLES|nr:hypothetical protein [Colocasia esculenta]